MKALKITFLVLAMSTMFVSCVKEDLNEDDQLLNAEIHVTLDTGGNTGEQ